MALHFHYETFEYSQKYIYQETFADFLCKLSNMPQKYLVKLNLLIPALVGGWLGLAVGASIISFMELIYFLTLLLRKLM